MRHRRREPAFALEPLPEDEVVVACDRSNWQASNGAEPDGRGSGQSGRALRHSASRPAVGRNPANEPVGKMNRFMAYAQPSATTALVIGLCGLLVLYVSGQVLDILAAIASLSVGIRFAVLVTFAIVSLVSLAAFGRLVLTYFRFRPNVQVRLADLTALERRARRDIQRRRSDLRDLDNLLDERARTRVVFHRSSNGDRRPPRSEYDPEQLHARQTRAKDTLERYMEEYRIALAKDPAANGLAIPWIVDQRDELTKLLASVSKSHVPASSPNLWLHDCRRFQAILDESAEKCVKHHAQRVAWKTAVSPNPLLDTVITAYWSFVLMRDLCAIYNVRAGGIETTALLWRAFFAAYVAGRLDEWEENVGDTLESVFEGLSPLAGQLVGKLTGKGAAGLANYWLMRRLGKRAIGLLQPLKSCP